MDRRGFLKGAAAIPLVGALFVLHRPKPKRIQRLTSYDRLTAEHMNELARRIEQLEDR
jgi:hypothetical protein